MMYYIKELSKLAGVSTRTIRHYDDIGLLKPAYLTEAGYRVYTNNEILLLQQIMLYKEMAMKLSDIKLVISNPIFDVKDALYNHLDSLIINKERTEKMIKTVENTIYNMESGETMSDNSKFEGFKKELIVENEKMYGKEMVEKYEDQFVKDSYKKFKKMSKYEYEQTKLLEIRLNNTIKDALLLGDPSSDKAQLACKLHKEWIMKYWPSYSKEAHLGLVEMYNSDDRFKSYYEKIGEGATKLLLDAMIIYLN